MLTAVSKHAATIRTADEAEQVLRTAVQHLRAVPHGPSSVEWPIDLQYASPTTSTGPRPDRSVPAPDADAVARAAEVIRSARRPLLWVGGGGTGAGDQVRELAERMRAGVLTSNSGRGSLPEDHELVIGNFATNPEAAELLADADLLVSIGTHFRSNETKHYALDLPTNHVQIDIDPRAIGRVYPTTADVVGEAGAVLPRLNAQIDQMRTDPQWPARVSRTREAVREHVRASIGEQALICDAVRQAVPRETIIARDVTIPSSQWGNRLLPIYHPSTNVFPVGGGIGQGLATGIGSALAVSEAPTVVLAGDGGLATHLGELATLAQERPWLVLVVFNDGGYGVLRNMQDEHVGRRSGVDLFTPDIGRLASSLDLPHALVNRAEAFTEAFSKAVDHHGPYVVEVDVTSLAPAPRPFVPPVHIPS